MLEESFKPYARSNIAWGDGVELTIIKKDRNNNRFYATPLVFKEVDIVAVAATSPCIYLQREEAEFLMQELWNAGIKPKEIPTEGQLSSIKYHLEDMRKLVFNESKLRV